MMRAAPRRAALLVRGHAEQMQCLRMQIFYGRIYFVFTCVYGLFFTSAAL